MNGLLTIGASIYDQGRLDPLNELESATKERAINAVDCSVDETIITRLREFLSDVLPR
jgi:hypothetical protein